MRRRVTTALLLLSLQANAADPIHPGRNRTALALGGTAAVAAGVVWFFTAGDQLGSGDPAAFLTAVGLVGTVGAIAGAGTVAWQHDEADLFGEASTPVVSFGFTPGGQA